MSASTPPPGGGPEPAPPAPPLSAGGDDENHDDHDDFSPLLDLLERFPDLFEKYVLEHPDPTARASLAGAGSAFLDVVFPRSIFPFGLPRAQETTGGFAARVFTLGDYLGTAERLAWAKANGCPWSWRTCAHAAEQGNVEALKRMREHHCQWDTVTSYAAARGGHLAVLPCARAHGCPWNTRGCEIASRHHPDTLAWVQQQPA
jgi:hypothetical protein